MALSRVAQLLCGIVEEGEQRIQRRAVEAKGYGHHAAAHPGQNTPDPNQDSREKPVNKAPVPHAHPCLFLDIQQRMRL